MPKQSLQEVFSALGHPVRFAVMDTLARGEASVGALAKPFDMALPSFMQHLEVLEECGLLTTKKVGRERICRLAPEPLRRAEGWMTTQRAIWERRLDQLDDYVLQMAGKECGTAASRRKTKGKNK